MFLFSFKKRALHLESLESRELMSVSPLTPGVFAQQQPVQSASGVAAESATVYPAPAVSDIKASGMMLTWDVSDFDHLRTDEPFKIEKASTVSGTKIWTQLGSDILYSYTAGKTEYSYQISGLEAATEYEFRVSFGSTKYGRAYTESVTVSTLQSELTAEALTSESVKLSWTIAAKSGTYFSVQKKDGSNWIEAGKYKAENTTAALRNFTVDDLEAGTDYEFKLVYYQPVSTGVQTETQTVTVKTLYTLTEANAETTNVELMYPPAVTGTGFIVQVCSGTSSPAQETNWTNAKINSAAAVANGFKVIGLKENTSYYFRVKYNVVVDGLTQTRYTDVLNYSSPTSITLSNATEKSIRVSWTFESKTGTANYIEISKTGNGADWIDSANTTATATTLNNLDAGTKYYIRVRYTSKAGVVSYSAVSTEETGVAAVLDSVSNNSASISWDIPGIANGTAVAVQRCDGSLDPDADTNWRTVENNCTTNSFTAEHLASNKKYYFRVQYELNGETKHTIYVDALTAGTLSAGETTIDTVKLDWNFVPKTSSTVTVQYFIGQSAPTSEAQWKPQPLTEADLDADRLGCTVKELTPGQKYFFRVIYTPEGSTVQQKSTVASATTQGEIFVAKEVNDTSITLHWAAAGFGAKKQENKNYIIYCWEESDRPNAKTWQVSEAISASANQYTFSGLLADTEYQFKIAYAGDTAANAVNSSPLVVETTPHRIDYTSTKNSIRLDWDFETFQHAGNNESQNGDGNGKFLVQRYNGTGVPAVHDAAADWIDVGETTNYSTKYYNITGLTPNITQYYRVVYTYCTGPAAAGAGNSWDFPLETKYSDILTATTQSDIRKTAVYENTVRLNWDAQTLNQGTQYTVQKRLAGQTAWADAAQTTATTFEVNGLTANTDYEFRILYNGTATSATLSVSTEKYLLSVISKTLDVDTASANVQMPYLPNEENNFKVYYRIKNGENIDWTGSESFVNGTTNSTAKTVSFDLSALLPETEYEFKAVYDTQGTAKESAVKTVSLSEDLSPSNVKATSAKIEWNVSSFPDKETTALYFVQWRETGAATWTDAASGTSAANYTITGLMPNKEYEVRLSYFTVSNVIAYSTVKTVKTGQPVITASIPQVGKIKAAWTFESTNGYTIEYKDDSGIWQAAATVSDNAKRDFTFSTIDGEPLEPDTEYTLRMKYRNNQTPAGEFIYSEEETVTTPLGLQIDDSIVSASSIKIKWDYTTDSTYKIQYRETGLQSWTTAASNIEETVKEYLIEGLRPGTKYDIKFVYSDSYEQEATLNGTTAELAPEAPTGVAVSGITADKVTVKWTDNSEYEEQYVIKLTNTATGVSTTTEIAFGIGTGEMSYELTGLDTKVSYSVGVYAKNAKGSSASATATFTTLDVARPAAVINVKAATTPKSVTLTWAVKTVENITDPDEFRIEFYDDTAKLWYEVQDLTVSYDSEKKLYSCTIGGSFNYGEQTDGTTNTKTLEDKTSYQFRIVALAPGGTTVYGNAPATAIKVTTAAMVVPSSLTAKNITMTSVTLSFNDTDKNVAPESKTYTLLYAAGEKKYTKWEDVPTADIVSVPIPAGTKTAELSGLQAGVVYTYVIQSEYLGETVLSKPATFTTAKPPAASGVKGGFTLTEDCEYAFRISWKVPAAKTIPDGVELSYKIEISATGKDGTYITIPEATVALSSTTALEYGVITFSETGKVLKTNSIDITQLTTLSVRVQSVFSQNGTETGSSFSAKGSLRLPKFV